MYITLAVIYIYINIQKWPLLALHLLDFYLLPWPQENWKTFHVSWNNFNGRSSWKWVKINLWNNVDLEQFLK